MTSLSPFSLQHDWKVKWNEVSDKPHRDSLLWRSRIEERAIRAVSDIGIIGGLQLTRIFFKGNKDRVKKLVNLRKLSRHTMFKGKQQIPIYTLGATGFEMFEPDYSFNDWLNWKEEDVLRSLVFFQLYDRLKEQFPSVKIKPAYEPYTGIIELKNQEFHVLVLRGNEVKIKYLFQWGKPTERIFYVKESEQCSPIDEMIGQCKARMITDLDFKRPFNEMFHVWVDGMWIKEDELNRQRERASISK